MKRQNDIRIGLRTMEEADRLMPYKSDVQKAKIIGCARGLPHEWRGGSTPSAMYLARLMQMGADIGYILLGERSNAEN